MSRLTFPQAMLFSIVIAATGAPAWPPQLQLEMHVPFDPTAFPSDGRYHLTSCTSPTSTATQSLSDALKCLMRTARASNRSQRSKHGNSTHSYITWVSR